MSKFAARLSLWAVGRDMALVIVRRPVTILSLMVVTQVAARLFGFALIALLPQATDIPAYIGLSLLAWILMTPVSVVGIAGTTLVVVRDLQGMKTDATQVIAAELRSIPSLAFLVFAMMIGVFLATLLLLVPGLILSVRWLVAVPTWVIEGGPLHTAVRRSEMLTAGSRWPLTLYVLTQLAVGLGLWTIILAQGGSSWTDFLDEPLPSLPIFLLEMIVYTLTTVGGAVCYVHLLRARQAAGQEGPTVA